VAGRRRETSLDGAAVVVLGASQAPSLESLSLGTIIIALANSASIGPTTEAANHPHDPPGRLAIVCLPPAAVCGSVAQHCPEVVWFAGQIAPRWSGFGDVKDPQKLPRGGLVKKTNCPDVVWFAVICEPPIERPIERIEPPIS
jgi:hypothetical protein